MLIGCKEYLSMMQDAVCGIKYGGWTDTILKESKGIYFLALMPIVANNLSEALSELSGKF